MDFRRTERSRKRTGGVLLSQAKFTMESGYEQAVDLLKKNMISISYRVRQIPLRQVRLRQLPIFAEESFSDGFGDNEFLKAVVRGDPNGTFCISDKWNRKRCRAVTGDK